MATISVTSPHASRRTSSPLPPAGPSSTDDARCDYQSMWSREELVETGVKDTVKLQKLFRRLQREVYSPEQQTCGLPWPAESCVETWRAERAAELGLPPPPPRVQGAAQQAQGGGRRATLGSPLPPLSPVLQALQSGRNSLAPSLTPSLAPSLTPTLAPSSPAVRPSHLPDLNSRPACKVMERVSPLPELPLEGEVERQKRKRATAIVTSGALTFIGLAAALVTASFLMSPVIEDVFVRSMLNHTEVHVANRSFNYTRPEWLAPTRTSSRPPGPEASTGPSGLLVRPGEGEARPLESSPGEARPLGSLAPRQLYRSPALQEKPVP